MGTKQIRRPGALILVVDLGGSLTKIIGGTRHDRREILAMEPEVIEIPKKLLEREIQAGGRVSPKDRAWVGINGRYHAVGHQARRAAHAEPMLRRPKASTAVPKILAALWVMEQRFGPFENVPLALCCSLPAGERGDGERLETELRGVLEAGFETPTGITRGRLLEFNCKAEGSGLFMQHRVKRGAGTIERLEVAAITCGYRNTSVMLFSRGAIGNYRTGPLGFASLLARVVKQTGIAAGDRLTAAVAAYLERGDAAYLNPLLPGGEGARKGELIEAIDLARQQYEIELSAWFEEIVPPTTNEILLGGGTVETMKDFFFARFGNKQIYCHAGVELPEDITALNLGYRYADCWCMWEYFLEKLRGSREIARK